MSTKFEPVNVDSNISIVPDYSLIETAESIVNNFHITFAGPGWYWSDSQTDTMLILPIKGGNKYRVHVWNGVDPRPLFKTLIG